MLTAERVIIAQDHTASAITIFHGLDVNLEPAMDELKIPTVIQLPSAWTLLVSWLREEGDEGRQFQQRTTIDLVTGSKTELGILTFSFAARAHQTVYSIPFFPIAGSGEYQVNVAIREDAPGARWKKGGSSPITVRLHLPTSNP